MAEEVFGELDRVYRIYIRRTVRSVCASILDSENLERLTQDVLIRMARRAERFSSSDPDSRNKLSRRFCICLNETLCYLLEDELTEKELFDLVARRHISPTAETAARRAFDEIYSRQKTDLKTMIGRNYPWLSEANIDDLMQEVNIKAFEDACLFKALEENLGNDELLHRQVTTWLVVIAKSKYVDGWRHEQTKVTTINAGDLPIGDAESLSDEAKLELFHQRREGVAAMKAAAENQHYPPAETRQASLESEPIGLVKMAAVRALLERDLDLLLTAIDHYVDENEQKRARRDSAAQKGIKFNHATQICKRCPKKIKNYLMSIVPKVLSGRDGAVFMAMVMVYDNDKAARKTWTDLYGKYHLNRDVVREIYQHGCETIMRYIKSHRR